MTDIEIAKKAKIKSIIEIAHMLGLNDTDVEMYGKYKAKINVKNKERKGKLILVTSTNPTPFGEGKTTVTIGIHDAMRKLGKNSIAALREPSLGPVFGIKGGATGGGYSQVIPMEDINLHFTGDIHAITSANNLLAAAIDNHIFQGNSLNIDKNKIVFQRCLDINDRALRTVTVGEELSKNVSHKNHFCISVASEIMAILCLSKDLEELKNKIANILVAYDIADNPIYAKDLKIENALTILLKDAIKPNLVQTLENNPVIIHGGPFANIAHGCNSLIATNLALSISDYVITEAGFGSDLGAEKFFDIKCRKGKLTPNVVVINTTIRSLKYNGNGNLKEGLSNLNAHIINMRKYLNNIIVCLNKFTQDTEEEIDIIRKYCSNLNVEFDVCSSFENGSSGAIDLAKKIINISEKPSDFKLLYNETEKIKTKINIVSKEIYHASKVKYEQQALKNIEKIEKLKLDKMPICIAKTQYSISDDPKNLGFPKNYELNVKDVKVNTGAGFITVYMGNIMTMPGLSKHPAYENMHINEENIEGLF